MLHDKYGKTYLTFDRGQDTIRLYGDVACLLPRRLDDEAMRMYLRWVSAEDTAMFLAQNRRVATLDVLRRHIEEQQDSPDDYEFDIMETTSGHVVGTCSLHISETNAQLGINIGDPGSRGKGIGSAALRLLIGFAFGELRAHRIELCASADNLRALRCYEGLGFSECGRLHEVSWSGRGWHDAVIMELLEDDWKMLAEE